ncbi:MAG: transporter, partial [Bacteroidota bacterium]
MQQNYFQYFLCGIFLLGVLQSSHAQAQQPSGLLVLEDYLAQVVRNHPASLRASLLRAEAAATLLSARGGFDPVLFGDYDDKQFKGSDYWEIGEGGLRIPTFGGLEFSGGYRWADGSFLNRENTQPDIGQAFAGVKAN